MWIVEVNVLGRRFTHRFDGRPAVPRFTPRLPQRRRGKWREPRAAA